ncbi:ZIP family metal transporter [Lunatibacter salilacus]|uniref:ZIP family metal transporter n=1 Tax=Lunatibacter salilacus TaxID=2483804 RepID=UPI00131E6B77|nr:ZIP family metal transporter [Lunatibacter salilacus]
MIFTVDFVYALSAALLVSLISLVGLVFLLFDKLLMGKIIPYAVALAIGVLLGNAFFHLIPESLELGLSSSFIFGCIFTGFVTFWLIDRILSHHHPTAVPSQKSIRSIGKLNLLGDGFHNFIDGLVIGGSFMISPEVGMATTLAIIIHELPQEFGDTGTLIYSGFSPLRVVKLNFLVSMTVMLGVAFVFLLNHWIVFQVGYLLAFTAGGFVYMALGNLLPALYRQARGNLRMQTIQLLVILIGLGMIEYLSNDHAHTHHGHRHGEGINAHQMGIIFRK